MHIPHFIFILYFNKQFSKRRKKYTNCDNGGKRAHRCLKRDFTLSFVKQIIFSKSILMCSETFHLFVMRLLRKQK